MNYYEEFGVSPSATSEEIRRAYKALARLVHPDIHSDHSLRTAAERQMKRINEIFEVLITPDKRRAYDESLSIGSGLNPVKISPAADYGSSPPGLIHKGRMSKNDQLPVDPKLVQTEQLVQNRQGTWYWIVIGLIGLALCGWYVMAPK